MVINNAYWGLNSATSLQQPNTGSLVRVNGGGTFSKITDGFNRPTSFEIVGNTAYIVTLGGEIWTVDNIAGPPYGGGHQKHLLHRHG